MLPGWCYVMMVVLVMVMDDADDDDDKSKVHFDEFRFVTHFVCNVEEEEEEEEEQYTCVSVPMT